MKRQEAKHNPFNSVHRVHNIVWTIGAEANDVRNVGMQLKDVDGNDITEKAHLQFYLSSDAAGNTIHSTAADAIAIGTDGIYLAQVAGLAGTLISEDDGDIDINITQDATATYYVNVLMPDGSIKTSPAIAFA